MNAAPIIAECLKLPQVPCPVQHFFGPGIYMRELRLEADTFAIGHLHKTPHVFQLLQGRVRVLLPDGSVSEVAAPFMVVSPPGRKAVYVLERAVCVTIHATEERDLDTLERQFIDKTLPPSDYSPMLLDLGVDEQAVRQLTEDRGHDCEFPFGAYKVQIGDSKIEGRGLLATADISEGETIAPALLGGKRTPAARYTNHSADPNASVVRGANGDVYWIARRAIAGNLGGDHGEEITIDYRDAIAANLGAK